MGARHHVTDTSETPTYAPTFFWWFVPTADLSVVHSLHCAHPQLDVRKMRPHSFLRAQSLASSSLRCASRSALSAPSRCTLSTIAASQTPYTNGTKTDTWINGQTRQHQRRWQSAAAQVYAWLSPLDVALGVATIAAEG